MLFRASWWSPSSVVVRCFRILDGQSMRTDLTWIWLRIVLAMMIYCHCYRYRCIIDRLLSYVSYKFIACPVLRNANTLNLNFCFWFKIFIYDFWLKTSFYMRYYTFSFSNFVLVPLWVNLLRYWTVWTMTCEQWLALFKIFFRIAIKANVQDWPLVIGQWQWQFPRITFANILSFHRWHLDIWTLNIMIAVCYHDD